MSFKMSVTRALLKLNKDKTLKKIANKKESLPFLTVQDVIELDERNTSTIVKKIALFETKVQKKTIANVECYHLKPNRAVRYFRYTKRHKDHLFLYVHGGGFCNGFALQGAFFMKAVMRRIGCDALSVEYSLSPENRYPKALDEIVACYREIITHYDPNKIVIGGESAGANLVLALLMYLRDNNIPMPKCALLASGYFDLLNTGKSYTKNESTDVSVTNKQTPFMSRAYLCGESKEDVDEQKLKHPYLSPMYGDFRDLPPMFFSVCADELLFDDSLTCYHKAVEHNKHTVLHINKKCFHAYMALGDFFKESKKVNNKAGAFAKMILGLYKK